MNENIDLIRPYNKGTLPVRKVKLVKTESFIQMAIRVPSTVKGNDMNDVNSIFEYMFSLPKASQWILSKILTYRNYKNNIAPIHGDTVYEQKMLKTGYKQLFEDGIICRIQRRQYMVNPSIVTVQKGLEENAYLNWNAHCHPDATVHYALEELGEIMTMDGKRFYTFLHQEHLMTSTDTELIEFLKLCREYNWLDKNDIPTGRAVTYEGFERALAECRKRGLL